MRLCTRKTTGKTIATPAISHAPHPDESIRQRIHLSVIAVSRNDRSRRDTAERNFVMHAVT